MNTGKTKSYNVRLTPPHFRCFRSVDVTFQVQRRVEAAGGDLVSFTKDEDINGLFSNPCPGVKKELRICYTCIGNDADLTTSSQEVTTQGYQRNVITHVTGEIAVNVRNKTQLHC